MLTEEKKQYSQGEEERHILAALEGRPAGKFLDIGAFNARTFSNSRALYEAGWGGVMIEPSPEPFLSLFKEYGNDNRIQLIPAAVGFGHGLLKFYASADAISTTEVEHYEKWKPYAAFNGAFWVPQITIPEILNQFGSFDFVNIDTEGTSAQLCMALLTTGMLPHCICVEHDGREAELAVAGGPLGYRIVFRSGENVVLSR